MMILLEHVFFEVKKFMKINNIPFFLIKEKLDFNDSDVDIIVRNKTGLSKIIDYFRSTYKNQLIKERKTYNQYYIVISDGVKIHAFDFSIGLILNGVKLIDSSFFFDETEENIREEYHIVKQKFKNKETKIKDKINNFIFKIRKGLTSQKGKLIIFIGVDGSGKSTIIDELTLNFSVKRKLLSISKYHFRPKIIKGSFTSKKNIKKSTSSPHSTKTLSTVESYMKILFIVLNYLLFLPYLYLKKFLGHIVMFDRHYIDLFFDEKRYRINQKSIPLAKLFEFIIPKPDKIFFVLGNEKIIYERKKEVELKEIISIQKKYVSFIKENPEISIQILNEGSKESFISEAEKKFISIL